MANEAECQLSDYRSSAVSAVSRTSTDLAVYSWSSYYQQNC